MRIGNFLLQRVLLIYILAPESCDSYMIFYNNYELFFIICICLSVSTHHMFVTFATDGHRAAGYILALAFEAL